MFHIVNIRRSSFMAKGFALSGAMLVGEIDRLLFKRHKKKV